MAEDNDWGLDPLEVHGVTDSEAGSEEAEEAEEAEEEQEQEQTTPFEGMVNSVRYSVLSPNMRFFPVAGHVLLLTPDGHWAMQSLPDSWDVLRSAFVRFCGPAWTAGQVGAYTCVFAGDGVAQGLPPNVCFGFPGSPFPTLLCGYAFVVATDEFSALQSA